MAVTMIYYDIIQNQCVRTFICTVLNLLVVAPLAVLITRQGLLITLLVNKLGNTEDGGVVQLALLKSQFSYLVNILVLFGHILEYTALLIGFILFLYKLKEDNILLDRLKKHCKTLKLTFMAYLCIAAIMLLHLGLSLAPSSYAIRWKESIIPSYHNSTVIAMTYGAFTMLSHIFNAITGSAMIIATVIVIHLWSDVPHISTGNFNLKAKLTDGGCTLQIAVPRNLVHVTISKPVDQHAPTYEDVLNIQSESSQYLKITIQEGVPRTFKNIVFLHKPIDEFQALKDNYECIGELVSAVQTIFEGWFVAYWVTYIFRITMDTTNIIKSVTTNNYAQENIQIPFIVIHWFYDFFNLMLTYACGQLMNYYHRKYYKRMKKNQEKILDTNIGQNEFFLKYVKLIPKRRGYQFLPSFCGFSIPLDNLGYLLTILLALFALIVTLTFDFLNP